VEPINKLRRIGLLAVALTVAVNMTYAQDMPQSWNDGASKQAIAAYVEKVTKERLPDYVSH